MRRFYIRSAFLPFAIGAISQTQPANIEVMNIPAIIDLILREPNKRFRPEAADLPGDFDYWFDGGAAIVQTGIMRYFFNDGATAVKSVLRPGSNYIRITLENGTSHSIPENEWGIEG